MNVQDFLPDECTAVFLKDGLTFVDCASYRALGILIFHPSMDEETQHLFHRQLVFAWHNLELPFDELSNLVLGIIDDYQHDQLFREQYLDGAEPEEFFSAGLDFVHVWLCSFVHNDFVGADNEEHRKCIKEVLRNLAAVVGKLFDQDPEEEEEEEEALLANEHYAVVNNDDEEEEEEEEELDVCELGVNLKEIRLYLENLDRNEPVADIPPFINKPSFDTENIVYNRSEPFPLRSEPEIIAEHFFYTGLLIVSKIGYSEYVNCSWLDDEKKEKVCPHIADLENHFVRTSSIIIDSILTAKELDMRLKVIERWIEIMEVAYNTRNFLFAFEIGETLKKPIIQNLKSTWRDVSKEILRKYSKLEEMTSTFKRYSKYKEEMKKTIIRQTLPFINPWLSEMFLISSQNPSYKTLPNGENGMNFAKQWAYYASVEYLKQPWGVDNAFLLHEQLLDDINNYVPEVSGGGEDLLMKAAKVVERSVILSPIPSPILTTPNSPKPKPRRSNLSTPTNSPRSRRNKSGEATPTDQNVVEQEVKKTATPTANSALNKTVSPISTPKATK